MKIAILGAGLSGLTIGYLLHKKGLDFDILEKEKECGGLARTLTENGFTFDFGGSHILFSKNEYILNFILDLIGGNKIKNKRNTKILFDDRYVKYPFENGLSDLPKKDNYECLMSFISNTINKEKEILDLPMNLREWCYFTFGAGIAEKYLLPYNKKIWKYPLEKTGLDWVKRIPNPPMEDIIRSSLGIETEGYKHQLFFYYPKTNGIQALIRQLEKPLEQNIVNNFNIDMIRKKDEKWAITNGKYEVEYDKIISTIPVIDLIMALDARREIKDAANKLKFNSLITVMLGVDNPNLNNLSWLYIPDETILTHRVSFPSNYSPCNAPKGKSSVLAEITCNIGDKIWMMNDNELAIRVIDDLDKVGIIDKKQVAYKKVKKLKYAYVINDIDYSRNLSIINNYLEDIGIDLIGRFSEFKYLNMDDCMENAISYVNKGFN